MERSAAFTTSVISVRNVSTGGFVARAGGFRSVRCPRRIFSKVRMDVKFADEETKLEVKTKDVFMPALSSTMTEGRIVQWLKQPGDFVDVGEIIMVVESDKADMDVESFEKGYLAQILTEEGESAGVGATVALLAETEEDIQKVIDCGTECIVPGSNHRHDGTTVVDLDNQQSASAKPAAPAEPAAPAAEKPNNVKEVFMPALSSTMTEGKVVQWLKKEGEKIAVGESVMVVESDKADMDVESFEEGIVAHIVVDEGDSTNVGEVVAYLAPSEAEASAIKSWASSLGSGPASAAALAPAVSAEAAAAKPAAPRTAPASSASVVNEGRIVASPYAKKLAAENGVDLKFVQGTGPGGRIIAEDVEAAKSSGAAAAPAEAPAYKSARVYATPDAKKVAKAEKINLDNVTGTGNFGRITADDVLKAAGKAPVQKEARAEAKAPAPSKKEKGAGPVLDGAVPMTAMQKGIAKNMMATLGVPVYSVSYEINTTAFDALYAKVKGKGVTTSSLLAKAVGHVLKDHQILNARYEEGDTHVYKKAADIGVAVATKGGLVTPVLRNCAETDIYSLSRSWKELVRKAVEKKLTGADMSNAHFYISNLGMFGVEHFNAILPKNAGTILAVSASKPKVVLQKNGLIGVEKFMNVNATCDHRVIQGAELAGFLRDLADFIENNIDEVMY